MKPLAERTGEELVAEYKTLCRVVGGRCFGAGDVRMLLAVTDHLKKRGLLQEDGRLLHKRLRLIRAQTNGLA